MAQLLEGSESLSERLDGDIGVKRNTQTPPTKRQWMPNRSDCPHPEEGLSTSEESQHSLENPCGLTTAAHPYAGGATKT